MHKMTLICEFLCQDATHLDASSELVMEQIREILLL